jgi:uncharacterized protein
MNRPVHFEIPANDPETVAAFYTNLFGWKITSWGSPEMGYWIVDTGSEGPGINGGILRRRHPEQPVVNTVEVADLDAAIAKAAEVGGQIVVPKMPIPTVGWLCYCKDPDGNIFGMMQNDTAAG